MIINSNLASNNTLRQMGINERSTQKSLAKLSSGLKINSAADDAAGLAISEKMRGQISGLNQASSNAQNGISLVSTAEGALNETTSVLQRMRELAVAASNDTNTTSDRAAMQTETNALISTIDSIGNDTQFNTKNLLNGGLGVKATSTNTGISAAGISANTKDGTYAVTITTIAKQAMVSGADFAGAGATAGTLSINGSNISIAASDKIGAVADKINNLSSSTGVTAIIQGSGVTQQLVLQSNDYGSAATVNISGAAATLTSLGLSAGTKVGVDVAGTIDGATAVGKGLQLSQVTDPNTTDGTVGLVVNTVVTNTASTSTIAAATVKADISGGMASGDTLTINGYTMTFETASGAAGTGTFAIPTTAAQLVADINSITKETGVIASENNGNLTLTTVATGNYAKLQVSGSGTSSLHSDLSAAITDGSDDLATTTTPADVSVNTSNTLKMQIGANQGQTMTVGINDMRAKALGVDKIDLTTASGAAAAITTIDKATAIVSNERSNLGAAQNRLEHTMNNLQTSSQNITTAEASIRDVDMATEMTNFTKNNILQQASQAMLSQANQQAQGVLQLLR